MSMTVTDGFLTPHYIFYCWFNLKLCIVADCLKCVPKIVNIANIFCIVQQCQQYFFLSCSSMQLPSYVRTFVKIASPNASIVWQLDSPVLIIYMSYTLISRGLRMRLTIQLVPLLLLILLPFLQWSGYVTSLLGILLFLLLILLAR